MNAGRGRHSVPSPTTSDVGSNIESDGLNGINALYRQALDASGVAVFVTGAWESGLRIEWVNSAFECQAGLRASDVLGRTPQDLRPIIDPQELGEIKRSLINGEPIRTILALERPHDAPTWGEVTATPIADESGQNIRWIWTRIDLTNYIEQYIRDTAARALDREEQSVLDVITTTTELLTDMEEPDALETVAATLTGGVIGWCGFYLNDDGLHYAPGVDVLSPPRAHGRRHGRQTVRAVGKPATGQVDVRGDSSAGESNTPAISLAVDPIQQLLDGDIEDSVELDLAQRWAPWSASQWLARDVCERYPVTEHRGRVVAYPVGGRNAVLGLLVAVILQTPDTREPAYPIPVSLLPIPTGMMDEPTRADHLLSVIARRAGSAVDNVRMYAREHRLAEALQRAMLPEHAEIPGLDVWTYYAPTSEHAQVGGDWYDVLQVTPHVAGLVIGDVVGHDIEAAAAMGQLRSVVRSYAFEVVGPGPVLERVDQLVSGMRIPRSASMVYGTLSRSADGEGPGADRWSIEYSRAGHLPPLLVRQGQVTPLTSGGGPMVGFGDGTRATGTVDIVPGDVLILYTDGLIERRDRSLREGMDSLIKAAAAITTVDAAGIGEELLSRLAEAPEDDVAIVIVRVPDPVADRVVSADSPRSRRWVLPSEAASIGRARHAVRRTCEAWGISEVANAELVVSELVANGVLHGWGHLALRLFDTSDGLRIEVEDYNPAPPVPTNGHANRSGGFGMQIVQRLAEWGWRPVGFGKVVWAVVPRANPAAK